MWSLLRGYFSLSFRWEVVARRSLRRANFVPAQTAEFDCYTLAKADVRCGKSVFKRKVNDENPSEWCWRGHGGDTPCSGGCDVVASDAMMLFEIVLTKVLNAYFCRSSTFCM